MAWQPWLVGRNDITYALDHRKLRANCHLGSFILLISVTYVVFWIVIIIIQIQMLQNATHIGVVKCKLLFIKPLSMTRLGQLTSAFVCDKLWMGLPPAAQLP